MRPGRPASGFATECPTAWTSRAPRSGRSWRTPELRGWVARSGPPRWQATRDDLSFRYLRGDGIEIGALFNPLRVPPEARVTYVDHAGLDELREIYSEHDWVQAPDVIDEGERLEKFAHESVDFVIANHMLEHVE